MWRVGYKFNLSQVLLKSGIDNMETKIYLATFVIFNVVL